MKKSEAMQIINEMHDFEISLYKLTRKITNLQDRKKKVALLNPASELIIKYRHEFIKPILTEYPELEYMIEEVPLPENELTDEQIEKIEADSSCITEIDQHLLNHATGRWRKVAMIIALSMESIKSNFPTNTIPIEYYSYKIRELVKQGILEAQGNLYYMRFSEVRKSANEIN